MQVTRGELTGGEKASGGANAEETNMQLEITSIERSERHRDSMEFV